MHTSRHFRLTLAALTTLVASGACTLPGQVCTAQFVSGLAIHVVDQAGAPVCDATVRATDGDYAETLDEPNEENDPDCAYTGAGERPGTYVVTAVRGGETAAETIVVEGGDCHVVTASATLTIAEDG